MGILDSIGKGKKRAAAGVAKPATQRAAAAGPQAGVGTARPSGAVARTRPSATAGGPASGRSKLPGKRRKGGTTSVRERVASAAAPLHDRRRRLVGARESTLRDLGGLMLEMYKRNRFREELLLDKCEEVLAIEVEIAHVDQRLFQLAPPNAAGMRPIGRCECGAPIHPGQNFCGVCGRSFATLTQSRSCARCGGGLRPGDQFCATCGTEAPDALQTIEAAPGSVPRSGSRVDATTLAASAVAETMIIDAPPLDEGAPVTGPDIPTPSVPGKPAPSAAASVPPSERPQQTPAAAVDAADVLDLPTTQPDVVPAGADSDPTTPGFDWSAAPQATDVAIDAAIEAAANAPNPTDPGVAGAGFPLTATIPPPPLADPTELPPSAADVTPPADPGRAADEATPSGAPVHAKAVPVAKDAAKQAKAAAKSAAKQLSADRKAAAKAAKQRAKDRAKAARDARKRGGKP